MESPRYNLLSLTGYLVALLFIIISLYIYSRNLTLRSSLDAVNMDYETLLSDKLQLERSYYRLKDQRKMESGSTDVSGTEGFTDSLEALKLHQKAEMEKLRQEIEILRKQLQLYEKK